jgi:hypothetical protein
VIIAAGAYYFSTTSTTGPTTGEQGQIPTSGDQQEEASNWETYQSDKHGFSIQYPKEWNLISNSENWEVAFLTSEDGFPPSDIVVDPVNQGWVRVDMGVYKIPNNRSPEYLIESWLDGSMDGGQNTYNISDVKAIEINGIKGVRIDSSLDASVVVDLYHKNNTYSFNAYIRSPETEDIFDEIMSTVRFN